MTFLSRAGFSNHVTAHCIRGSRGLRGAGPANTAPEGTGPGVLTRTGTGLKGEFHKLTEMKSDCTEAAGVPARLPCVFVKNREDKNS